MAYPAHFAVAKDFRNKVNTLTMKNPGENMKRSLVKYQNALSSFIVRREEFILTRNQTLFEIDKAKTIWFETMNQLPKKEFK